VRVVLDTNVVVSALLHDGPTGRFRELWRTSTLQLLASQTILDEYVRVLYYPKFGFQPGAVADILSGDLLPYLRKVEDKQARLAHPPKDVQDEPFIRTALVGKAEALVSGDSHLLVLDGKYPFPILKPALFLARFFPKAAS
jgi:uncharacterized protein